MQIKEFEFEVLVNGKSVNEYDDGGLTYIEGKEGTEFAIRMRNRTSKRVLFVPTIDGLSVMDGKEASFDSSGYIVGAYSTETIDGWRRSDNEVAKFFFTKVKDSYAAKADKGGNEGIIGCAVVREKEKPQPIVIEKYIHVNHYPYPYWPNGNPFLLQMNSAEGSSNPLSNTHTGGSLMGINTSASAQAMNTSAPAQAVASFNAQASAGLGTGFGEVKYSPTRSVEFERESAPTCVFNLRYNTRENLEAMGVKFKKPLQIAQAFPAQKGYCEPPKGWQG